MTRLLSLFVFLLISFGASAQFDYKLFQNYSDSSTRSLNRKVISTTELLKQKDIWLKTAYEEFNPNGLPVKLIQFDEKGAEAQKKEFHYDVEGYISNIETFKSGKHYETTTFELNSLGQIISYSDYVYSSYNGEKMLLWKTYLEYNSNQKLQKSIKIRRDDKDTVEINFYDASGGLVKSFWNQMGLRSRKITYVWNKDKNEMEEHHYENDSTIYSTIIHKYKDGKEVEKIDPSISSKPFYWKYDSSGRVIETNEAYFYVLYYTYDVNGRLTNKVMNVLFSDADEKDLPKKFYYKYDYQNRN